MIQSLQPASRLIGTVILPGDKSISHRYALLAAIAEGSSELRHFASSEDCQSTLKCLQALGTIVRHERDSVIIEGRGLRGLSAPNDVLDAGNSGTTMRLLAGLLAGHPFGSSLTGDASLCGRPMGRVMEPLRLMGARVESRNGGFPPLTIFGGNLKGIRYALPVASAQVKSCVLLAGLFADTPSAVHETIPTRDHTEIALRHFGATLSSEEDWIVIEPGPRLCAQNLEIPGDLSGATFFLAAATLVPGSEIHLPGVGLNHRRRELLDYLLASGADITVGKEWEVAGESRGNLRVRYSPALLDRELVPIRGGLVASLIDEIPMLAILGSQAGGVEISDASELRLKESDRIAALAQNLRAMGAAVDEKPDGLRIRGRQRLRGTDILTKGDHRIAMAFAIAGLIAEGRTRIHEAQCVNVSFPGFFDALAAVGAKV